MPVNKQLRVSIDLIIVVLFSLPHFTTVVTITTIFVASFLRCLITCMRCNEYWHYRDLAERNCLLSHAILPHCCYCY